MTVTLSVLLPGSPRVSAVGVFLNGEAITDRDRRGQRITDDSFLVLFNAQGGGLDWALPKQWGKRWGTVLDTTDPEREGDTVDSGAILPVTGRSVVVLRRLDEPAS